MQPNGAELYILRVCDIFHLRRATLWWTSFWAIYIFFVVLSLSYLKMWASSVFAAPFVPMCSSSKICSRWRFLRLWKCEMWNVWVRAAVRKYYTIFWIIMWIFLAKINMLFVILPRRTGTGFIAIDFFHCANIAIATDACTRLIFWRAQTHWMREKGEEEEEENSKI